MDAWTFSALVALLVILGLLVVFGPIFTIWSLNTIFGLQIPVTFQTWAATIWLLAVVRPFEFRVKKNN